MAMAMVVVVVVVVEVIAPVTTMMIALYPVMLEVTHLPIQQLSVLKDAWTMMQHVQYMEDINGALVSSILEAIVIAHTILAAVAVIKEVGTQTEVHQCQMVIKPMTLRMSIIHRHHHPIWAQLQVQILLEMVSVDRILLASPFIGKSIHFSFSSLDPLIGYSVHSLAH